MHSWYTDFDWLAEANKVTNQDSESEAQLKPLPSLRICLTIFFRIFRCIFSVRSPLIPLRSDLLCINKPYPVHLILYINIQQIQYWDTI